jgi:hypothetical protein
MVSSSIGAPGSLTRRAIGAATLDIATYEEVEADTHATMQAATVVALAAIARAIGASDDGSSGIIGALIGALAGWAIWAGLTYIIGAKVFHGTANWGELARTLGFAQAPGFLYLLGVISIVGGLFEWLIGVWILVTGIIAIRQALDITTGKAIITAIIGWAVVVIPMLVLGTAVWFGFGRG